MEFIIMAAWVVIAAWVAALLDGKRKD